MRYQHAEVAQPPSAVRGETAITFGGAVVLPKPIAKKTTCRSGWAAARLTASSGD